MSEFDEIEILEHIDSGLYGSVYRANQQSLGRQVAVKIIKTDMAAADALAHAAPLARMNHPAIVTVYTIQEIHIPDLGRSVPAIVMEWVEGETLGKRLSLAKFSIEELRALCRDVLDGVDHLHENGICHGDLHAGNIIILRTGRAKIIDVDANKDISLARLSTLSQDGAKASDVDYCRGVVFKLLRHSMLPLSVIIDGETKLESADSIALLQEVVDLLSGDAGHLNTSDSSYQATQPAEWIDQIAKVATADEVIALLDTQAYFELLNIPYPPSRDSVLTQLQADGAIRTQGSNWSVTNLGAILFAKKLDTLGQSVIAGAIRVA